MSKKSDRQVSWAAQAWVFKLRDLERQMERTFVVAEPLTMVRDGFIRLLETQEGNRVVGQCATGALAWQCLEALVPQVAILDSSLTGPTPAEILRKIKGFHLPTKVLVISSRKDRNFMLEMFRAGADGFVLKSDSSLSILEAIECMAQNRYYVSPVMQNTDLPPQRDFHSNRDPLELLSNREYQVFSLLVEGVRAKEIAHRLSLSPKTVDTHRASLMRKLDIHDIPGLVKFALSRNIITAM